MIQIENKEHLEQILAENSVVVMDFYAEWCGPCKQLLPTLEKLSEEQQNVVFCKINVDQNEDLSRSYGVRSIPSLKYVKNGEVIKTTLGVQPAKNIIENIEENIFIEVYLEGQFPAEFKRLQIEFKIINKLRF